MPMYHGMDLAQFKKVKSDDRCTTLRHAKGHEIKIAHKALTPKLKEMIDGLKMFADGGEAMDDSSPATADDTPSDVPQVDPIQVAPQEPDQSPPGNMVMQDQQNGAAPPQTPPVVDQIPADSGNDVTVTAPPRAIPDPVEAQQEAQKEFSDQGKINPQTMNSLFASKDTPGKIGMVLGMMLSGAGSGLAHQPNALLDILNSQLNRDMDAQKTSSQNAQNWYHLNQQNEINKANISNTNADTNVKAETATQRHMANQVYWNAAAMNKQLSPDQQANGQAMLDGVLAPWRDNKVAQADAQGAAKLSMLHAKDAPNYVNGIDQDKLNAAIWSAKQGPGIVNPDALRSDAQKVVANRQLHDYYNKAFNDLNSYTADQGHEAAGTAMEGTGAALGALSAAVHQFGGDTGAAMHSLGKDTQDILNRLDQKRNSYVSTLIPAISAANTGSVGRDNAQEHADAMLPTIYDLASGPSEGDVNELRKIKHSNGEDFFRRQEDQLQNIAGVPGAKEPFKEAPYIPFREKKVSKENQKQMNAQPQPTPFGG